MNKNSPVLCKICKRLMDGSEVNIALFIDEQYETSDAIQDYRRD
jgi:hypothetical protein